MLEERQTRYSKMTQSCQTVPNDQILLVPATILTQRMPP